MRFKRFIAAATALSMTATPALAASASPAASLSLTHSVRAPAKTAKNSNFVFSTELLGIVVAIAIIAAAAIVISDDGNDSPASP